MRAWFVSVALLAVAISATLLSDVIILSGFPGRPRPHDLLFELLPYVNWVRYLTLIALVIGFALFLYYAIRHEPTRIPEFVAVYAVFYLLRAALAVLTPLASAQGDGPFVFPMQQYGMFPSGHAGVALVTTLLTSAERALWLHRIEGMLTAVICVSLVLAHGHYSIDIAGGMLLGFFVVQVWERGTLFRPLKRLMGRDPGPASRPRSR